MIFLDGMKNFSYLTAGVWTDATVRAYNVIGRSDRYLDDAAGAGAQRALARMGVIAPPTTGPVDSLHEQVMHLMAVSRTVVYIPVPMFVIVTKVSRKL
jgi:hypothetical protein